MPVSKLPCSQESDAELFLLVKQNDIKAFEKLYNRYWPFLVNTANNKLHSREKAEDIVQNIFIDIYQRRAAINIITSLKVYLNQALKFKILNEYRSEMISAKYQRHIFFNPDCKIDFANALEAKELELTFNSVFNKLPEKCRQVFLLSRKENLSNKDISVSLRITISTVEKHIGRALKTLRTLQA